MGPLAVQPADNRQFAGAARSYSSMTLGTETLIIGAGPFGLTLSAHAPVPFFSLDSQSLCVLRQR